ncbi:dihydrodipicolinate synthase family protein (plasmid) [Alloyangia pacifica]|uniref:Dihydrodipicolinate synthase family protein n=1 Tax=Alloyangia pacifica TaxID=311180 RepID=A0A2U8HJA5_9RHOB|nr:dihydrodipicolinate synthase family protein [Alloyangia pacifica]AWI85924.1 dihydrodipicolinate synthase family protein [Alloyangia pacifica]
MSAPLTLDQSAKSAPRAHLFGVSVAMVTPFTESGSVDLARLAAHAADVVGQGVDGITLYGTTGEGASLGMSERAAMLDAVKDAGVPADRITVGIAACDPETAETQARAALSGGASRLLLAPPFYFKGITDDALFTWVTEFVARLGDASPEIILYHIPQVTGVSFDAPLVRRLKDACGAAIYGVKDSAGRWDHATALLPMDDLAILIGDERLLARAAPLGGAGAISGMANLLPGMMRRLVHAGEPQPALDSLVDEIVQVPVTPLVKALVGAARDEDGWQRTRAPLQPADASVIAALAPRVEELAAIQAP